VSYFDLRIFRAVARFLSCERSCWHSVTMPGTQRPTVNCLLHNKSHHWPPLED